MTNMTALQQNLTNNFSDLHLRLEEPLAHHTSFHIGGPCEVFAAPATVEQLRRLLAWCGQQGIRPLVLGAGTNVLAPDEGLRGLVIATRDCLKGVEAVSATRIRALAGTSMANVAVFAQKMGLTGLEFAHGIPGSIGGGVYMNAGAYGGEMVQVVAKSEYLTLAGEAGELVGDAHDFSYRHSAYSGGDKIITAVELGAGLLLNRRYGIWDYRDMPLNFRGQICLPYSLLWLPVGLGGCSLYRLLDKK